MTKRGNPLLFTLISLLFLTLSSSNSTTTQQSDILASLLFSNIRQLIRIQKKAEPIYPFTLAPASWTPYPQLKIQFELPFSQFVNIKYHVMLVNTYAGKFSTRIFIDDKENQEFRSSFADVKENTNSVYDQVYLEKGKHTIKVQYKIIVSWAYSVSSSADTFAAFLKIRYYEPGQPFPVPRANYPVIKTSYADNDYYFINNNKWLQFPNLLVVFDLDFDQIVEISYHIITQTQIQCRLSTQLKIDGKVDKSFNGISGTSDFHQISVIGRKFELKKGVHYLQLEYKTPGLRNVKGDKDQHVAFLQVIYHQSSKNLSQKQFMF